MIPGLNMPLLLIGGTHDVLVPASDVSCIFAAAPEPKTYREFATGHDYKNHPQALQEINDVTVELPRLPSTSPPNVVEGRAAAKTLRYGYSYYRT